MSYRALDSAGWWVSRLIKRAKRSTGARGGREEAEGIKRDIGNIKYKCNLPRFMPVQERRERRREEEEEEEVDEGVGEGG